MSLLLPNLSNPKDQALPFKHPTICLCEFRECCRQDMGSSLPVNRNPPHKTPCRFCTTSPTPFWRAFFWWGTPVCSGITPGYVHWCLGLNMTLLSVVIASGSWGTVCIQYVWSWIKVSCGQSKSVGPCTITLLPTCMLLFNYFLLQELLSQGWSDGTAVGQLSCIQMTRDGPAFNPQHPIWKKNRCPRSACWG